MKKLFLHSTITVSITFLISIIILGTPIHAGSIPEPLPSPARIKAGTDGIFSILAVTDLHFFAKGILADPQTVKELGKLVEKFQPDLLVVTGDMWHNNPGGDGIKFLKWSGTKLGKLGVPWAFAWGNHDDVDNFKLAHALLERAPNSLYRGAASDGNYRIEITDEKGNPAWNLIFLNDSRGGMKEPQVEWFLGEAEVIKKNTPSPPPAFLFFHIPLLQYDEIVNLGIAKGVKYESVCHDGESGKSFASFRDSGMVKAMFCGHDHVNDYSGKLDGIELVYARATGAGGYGADRVKKGGTLITINVEEGTYDFISVMPDGSTWEQAGFESSD